MKDFRKVIAGAALFAAIAPYSLYAIPGLEGAAGERLIASAL